MARRTSNALLLLAAVCFAACLGISHAGGYTVDLSPLCKATFTVVEDGDNGEAVYPPGESYATNGTTYIFKDPLILSANKSSGSGKYNGYQKTKTVEIGSSFGVCSIFETVEVTATTGGYSGYKSSYAPKAVSYSDEYCDFSLLIAKLGTIELQGRFLDKAANVFKLAIVGGTGAYEGASGHVEVKVLAYNSMWQYTVYLEDAPSCPSDY